MYALALFSRVRKPGVDIFGITFYGFNAQNLHKFVLSVVLIGIVLLVAAIARTITRVALSNGSHATVETKFWLRQIISFVTAIAIIAGSLSIWFNDPGRLATAFGLFSAGIAFALQQVITSIASYFVILRGPVFTVGDRISMGAVRGDVLRLGFIQTTIMEMGQPPAVQ